MPRKKKIKADPEIAEVFKALDLDSEGKRTRFFDYGLRSSLIADDSDTYNVTRINYDTTADLDTDKDDA